MGVDGGSRDGDGGGRLVAEGTKNNNKSVLLVSGGQKGPLRTAAGGTNVTEKRMIMMKQD